MMFFSLEPDFLQVLLALLSLIYHYGGSDSHADKAIALACLGCLSADIVVYILANGCNLLPAHFFLPIPRMKSRMPPKIRMSAMSITVSVRNAPKEFPPPGRLKMSSNN